MLDLYPWLIAHGFKIILILVAAWLVSWFLRGFLKKLIKKTVNDKLKANSKRVDTLVGVFGGTLNFVVWVIALLMILPEFGVNIAPILAGVGLLGLAVGMAAKEIISDFISGLFILLENQYQVGDSVKVAGIEGKVQDITLRRTILQDSQGVQHSVPNSQIKTVTKNLK